MSFHSTTTNRSSIILFVLSFWRQSHCRLQLLSSSSSYLAKRGRGERICLHNGGRGGLCLSPRPPPLFWANMGWLLTGGGISYQFCWVLGCVGRPKNTGIFSSVWQLGFGWEGQPAHNGNNNVLSFVGTCSSSIAHVRVSGCAHSAAQEWVGRGRHCCAQSPFLWAGEERRASLLR